MSEKTRLTVKRNVYMTPEMSLQLGQFALQRGRDCNENVIIREAIRYYFDNQEDILGSRRHFQKSFQLRIDELEKQLNDTSLQHTQMLLFFMNILIQLVAFSLSHIITSLTHKEITPEQLITKAVIQARKEEFILLAQVQSVREMEMTDAS
jgi:hypothetical protein